MKDVAQENPGIFVAGFIIGGLLGAAVALIIGARVARSLGGARPAVAARSNGSTTLPRSGGYFGEEPADNRDESETPRIVLDRGNGVTGLTNGDGSPR